METIRSLGGDALTLVSEMPLFLLPDEAEEGEPNDVVEIDRARSRPMNIIDQMRLQWTFIAAGAALAG